jgi:hypothetical protein
MKQIPIFISSADTYSDIWPVFFDLFKKCWPDFNGSIYLNTEKKLYDHETIPPPLQESCQSLKTDEKKLDIRCTQVGKLNSFGKTFRAGLDKINSDFVLLIMIDYLFMGKVKQKKLTDYFDFFLRNDLDSFCLIDQHYDERRPVTGYEDINMVLPPSRDMFSFQIAFWKKETLYKMVLPHENPWSSEWYGTKRANKRKIKLACLSPKTECPIPYHPAGCLHKGKWLNDAVEYLNRINYPMDFNKRGFFIDAPQTKTDKRKMKWMFIKAGLKGSYWKL